MSRQGSAYGSAAPVSAYARTAVSDPRIAQTGRASKHDSGLIRVFDTARAGTWAVNAGALAGGDLGQLPAQSSYSPTRRPSQFVLRPTSPDVDPYDEWDVDEAASRKVFGNLVTPGAWAVVAVVVLAVLAFVFVTPAFAVSPGAISRYSEQSQGAISGPEVAAPVIDVGTTPGEGVSQVVPHSSASDGNYSLIGAPSISVAQIEFVLQKYGSPATGLGQQLYDLGVSYDINPAYALAFFVHESACGTKGVARFTKSLGNVRWSPGWDNYSGYRMYPSWVAGMEDWYKLITDLYINQWGLRTVDDIVPVYAPADDGNSPSSYAASVKWMVDDWRGK